MHSILNKLHWIKLIQLIDTIPSNCDNWNAGDFQW